MQRSIRADIPAGFCPLEWRTYTHEHCRTQGCKAKEFPAVHFAFRAAPLLFHFGSFLAFAGTMMA
jgi:hypothetical protein